MFNFTLSIGSSDYTPENNGSVTAETFELLLILNVETSVNITNDFNLENNETFFINLIGCSPGCVISPDFNAVTVTIQGDESKWLHAHLLGS